MSASSAQLPDDVVQISITMERQLKERYAKLAVQLDLSFSQLVRYSLRRVDEGIKDLETLEKLRDRDDGGYKI
tara:strand:+ start:155 stop:373 length:219 start_codon:yes stop_codon:yes gene_type:complete